MLKLLFGIYLNFILFSLYEEWFVEHKLIKDSRLDYNGYKCRFSEEYSFDVFKKKCSFERYLCKTNNQTGILIKYGSIEKFYSVKEGESFTNVYFMSDIVASNPEYNTCECNTHYSATKVLSRCMGLLMDGKSVVMRSRYKLTDFEQTIISHDETIIRTPDENIINVYKFISDSNLLLLN